MSSEEWWWLGCNTCGHWQVAPFTKVEVADWARLHPDIRMRPDESHIARASTCPHPCGSPFVAAHPP